MKTRIAAMGDLHINTGSSGAFRQIFAEISKQADVLLLCGDLTQDGLLKEAEILVEELSFCKIPIAGILGNHDFSAGQQEEVKKILSNKQMHILDNRPYILKDVGIAGTKGFGGGFDKHLTAPYGEQILKQFVFEAVNEAIKLEEALANLETDKKIVVLHYSPIRQTIVGESPEIYPLLGTSRLAQPIDDFNVTAAFHGHAHHGSPEGKTNKGIPVYNVSFSLLSRLQPHQPYRIIEI